MAAIELFRWDPATVVPGPEADDEFVLQDAWNDVMFQLGEEVRARESRIEYSGGRYNPIWYNLWFAEGTGLGWRKQAGRKIFKTESVITPDEIAKKGESFIHGLLPNTEGTFIVYRYDIEQPNTGLLIVNYHHDSPEGDRYVLMPLAWMFQEGYWWGIEESEERMIPEIREAVFDAWEEYLMGELEKTNRITSDSGGTTKIPDWAFEAVFTDFLKSHIVTLQSERLIRNRKEDFEEFKRIFSLYQFDFYEDWRWNLRAWMKEDYEHDGTVSYLGDYAESFFENFGMTSVPKNVQDEMERIYKEVEKSL